MKLQLAFDRIVDDPQCKILINQHTLYEGVTQSEYTFNLAVPVGSCRLTIVHCDKKPEHTIVENGIIVRDRSFELVKCMIDGYDLQELIWLSRFVADHGEVYNSCLFFGPNGEFQLDFENPVLRWILRSRHERDNNDPQWEQDFEYYQQACKLLQLISNK